MGQQEQRDITPEQTQRLFRYLLRKVNMRDYLRLYPSMQDRFPILLKAMPDAYIDIAFHALQQAEEPLSNTEKLTGIFNLTRAESALALLLMAGHSLTEIAKIKNVSRNTARNHLQNIFEKTGTNRQPELIRRLHDLLD